MMSLARMDTSAGGAVIHSSPRVAAFCGGAPVRSVSVVRPLRFFTMSWQSYVDNQICGEVSCRIAAIAGLQDGAIWAKFESDPSVKPVTQQELKRVADGMRGDPATFQATGIHLGGEKYICLYAEASLLRGRKGGSALVVVATNTCLLVAATTDGFPAGQLNAVVEKLGDYLRSNNY